VKHKHNSKVQTDAVNRSIQAIDDLIQSCPDVPEYTPEIAEWILNSAMLTVESPGKSQSVCVSLNKPISRAVMAVTAAAAGIALWHVARANITLSVGQRYQPGDRLFDCTEHSWRQVCRSQKIHSF